MKKMSVALLSLAAALLIAGSPAAARSKVSCKQIKEALASGKSADDVAAELKTTAARVNKCSKPSAKAHKKGATTAQQ
jgi:hypothetical protein